MRSKQEVTRGVHVPLFHESVYGGTYLASRSRMTKHHFRAMRHSVTTSKRNDNLIVVEEIIKPRVVFDCTLSYLTWSKRRLLDHNYFTRTSRRRCDRDDLKDTAKGELLYEHIQQARLLRIQRRIVGPPLSIAPTTLDRRPALAFNRTMPMKDPDWLEWARELQAIAQIGLTFCRDP